MSFSYEDKISWILRYCSEYSAHDQMYDERCENLGLFNMDLGIENYITTHISGKQIVLLTGDAGDGKTRTLANMKDLMKDVGWEYIYDFSELDELKITMLIENINDILSGVSDKKYMIAANAGILSAHLDGAGSAIRRMLKDEKCLCIDLSKRNLAKDRCQFSDNVKSFLDTKGVEECVHCQLRNNCVFKDNIKAVCSEPALSNIWIVYYAIFLEGYHVTIRDMLSSLAFIITGGYDCASLRRKNGDNAFLKYYENIFNFQTNADDFNGNRILKAMALLDPAKCDVKGYDKENCKKFSNDIVMATRNKRMDFFEKQERLMQYLPHETVTLELLNADYLREFKTFLSELSEIMMLDSVESTNSTIALIENGLNRLSNPYRTNSEMILYDTPPLMPENFRIVFTTEVFQYLFCTHEYHKGNNILNASKFPMMDDNSFVCVLYAEEQYDEGKGLSQLPFLPIDYNMFCQILHAGNNIFRHANIVVRDSIELKSFIRAIITNSNSLKSFSVQKRKANGGITNINMSIMTPSKLAKNKDSKLNISK